MEMNPIWPQLAPGNTKPDFNAAFRSNEAVLVNNDIYLKGSRSGEITEEIWKYSISSKELCQVPTPTGDSTRYVLATYHSQLVCIGGYTKNNICQHKVFVFDGQEWSPDVIPPLPERIGDTSTDTTTSEGNTLILAWVNNQEIKMLWYDGQQWSVKRGPECLSSPNNISILLHSGNVFIRAQSGMVRPEAFWCSVEDVTTSNENKWKMVDFVDSQYPGLQVDIIRLSNLTVLGGNNVVIIETKAQHPAMFAFVMGNSDRQIATHWKKAKNLGSIPWNVDSYTSIVGLGDGTLLVLCYERNGRPNFQVYSAV